MFITSDSSSWFSAEDEYSHENITIYSFLSPKLDLLQSLIEKKTAESWGQFQKSYGGILKIVYSLKDHEISAIHTLLQFYDPPLRCFTFPDYHIGLTLEDYASLLGGVNQKSDSFPSVYKEIGVSGDGKSSLFEHIYDKRQAWMKDPSIQILWPL